MPTEPVNVLVTTPIEQVHLDQIAAVSPRVKVRDASTMLKTDQEGSNPTGSEFDTVLAEADVIYGHRLPRDFAGRMPRLKWVQVMSAGVDAYLDGGLRKSPVTLTNVSGIHATPIGEFVLEQMLMFAKGAALGMELQRKREWRRFGTTVLRGKTVGVIGLGEIGREVARLSKAFGMRVIATRRSTKRETRARNVDLLLPSAGLHRALAESDFVVIALPYTKQTDRVIGEAEFKTMKATAYIINIGRGRIIDEEAMIRALSEKQIAGAGLDVFATEPLPPSSKLWEMPNVICSPHISGGMEDYNGRATDLFCRNLEHFLAGRRLFNVVGKRRGY